MTDISQCSVTNASVAYNVRTGVKLSTRLERSAVVPLNTAPDRASASPPARHTPQRASQDCGSHWRTCKGATCVSASLFFTCGARRVDWPSGGAHFPFLVTSAWVRVHSGYSISTGCRTFNLSSDRGSLCLSDVLPAGVRARGQRRRNLSIRVPKGSLLGPSGAGRFAPADGMRASDSSDDESAASIASTELPEWAGDDLACELCGDAGGAGLLVLCENCEDGCAHLAPHDRSKMRSLLRSMSPSMSRRSTMAPGWTAVPAWRAAWRSARP